MLFFSTNQRCAAQNRAEIIRRDTRRSIRIKKHSEQATYNHVISTYNHAILSRGSVEPINQGGSAIFGGENKQSACEIAIQPEIAVQSRQNSCPAGGKVIQPAK